MHDYIVGNPDRHMKNITYRFDENGKICGLMGIDNDTCFGEEYIADNYSQRRVSPDKMSIITATTAKKILALDENTLRNSLYGFDLTVKEVDGAIERLKIMKDVINTSVKYYEENKIPEGKLAPGVPRIVEEKDLDKYSFEKDLIYYQVEKMGKRTVVHGNMFAAVYAKMVEKQTVIDDTRKSNMNRLTELSDNVLTTGNTLLDTAKKMEDINGWYHFGSGQFDDMLEKTAKAARCALINNKQLFDPVKDYSNNTPAYRKDYEPSAFTKDYKKKCEEALAATEKYLTERAAKNKDVINKKKNTAGWKRYQLALTNREALSKTLKKLEKAEKAIEDNKTITAKEPELLASAGEQKTQEKKVKKNISKTI